MGSTDLSEGRSTGIPTIQDELARNGSSQATFKTDADRSYFLVDIPCHPKAIRNFNLVSKHGKDILRLCLSPKSRNEIFEAIGLKNHTFNYKKHIKPLIGEGLIAYTSQAANSPSQKYITTDKGKQLLNSES